MTTSTATHGVARETLAAHVHASRRLGASPSPASWPSSCASRSTPAPGSGCWPASASPPCSPPAPSSPGRPTSEFTYSQFTLAIGVPMSVILPIIAVLSVTAEWSQRSGLTTFTLVPHRGRVLLAKAVAAVLVAAAATAGRVRRRRARQPGRHRHRRRPHRVGPEPRRRRLLRARQHAAPAGRVHPRRAHPQQPRAPSSPTWSTRSSPPDCSPSSRSTRPGSDDVRPWVDPKYNQDALLQGGLTGEQWTQLAVTTVVWLVLPLLAAVVNLLRSEVK